MQFFSNSRGRAVLLSLGTIALAIGCSSDETPLAVDKLREPLAVGIDVSSSSAAPGDRIAVAVHSEAPEALKGIQGYVQFDASRLAYVGQSTGKTFVLVND